MIRKLLFSINLLVFLITASSLYAGDPIRSNKLVYFSQFNTLTSSYPVSQSASNFDSNLVSSATIDYGGSGISRDNFARTSWNITNASSTLDPATAPYVEYAINFNNSVNIDLDRFVITGGASNYSTKFELRWSKDNYATRLGLFSVGSDWQYKLTSVNLNTLSNFTGTQLKFRLYFYDTSASGSNFVHSDTGPYTSLDGTPTSYDIWTATATIWVNPPPAISSITPSTAAIGSTVVITGTDFTGSTAVSFHGTNAPNFIVDSPTQITATVPVGTTTGPITITTANGTGTSASNFTVLPPPTITSFTPSSGAVGTDVTITGSGFDAIAANNTVYFDGVKATITSASATQLVATFPTGTSGFAELSVINTTNKLAVVANKKFYSTFYNAGFVDYTTSAFAPKVDFTAVKNTYTALYGAYLKTPCLYADFNLDGKPDYVQTGDASTAVIPNTSTIALISFGTKIVLNTGGNGAKVGDIDNDGLLDLIINDATTINVYKNTSTIGGTISFASPITIAFAADKNKVLLKDMNGDGLLDLIGSNSSTIRYLLNTTTASIISFNTASPVAITAPAGVVDFGVVNLDNNGQLDIIALHSTGYSIRFNSAAFSSVVSSNNPANNITIGDINNDGYFDFVIDFSTTSFKYFQNNGSNTFTETIVSIITTGGSAIRSLALAEMNGNALPDIVSSNHVSPAGFNLANNTSTSGISFASGTRITYSLGGYNVAAVANDIDGDGRPDLTTLLASNGPLGNTGYTVVRNIIGLPTITSFIPTSGNTGTSITITGTAFTGATAVTINGNPVTSFTINSDTSITAIVPSGTTGPIRVTNAGGTNISSSNFTYNPTIFTTGTLTAFSKCSGSVSASQNFTVSGANLTADLVVAAYTGLEYSLDGTTYSSTLSITPTSGTVASTTIYVRMTAGSTSLTPGSISLTSTSATTQTISVSSTINTATAITAQPSTTAQTYCQNTTPTDLSVTATGLGLTYQWYKNTTASTSGATLVTGATSSTYTPATSTTSALYYYCVVTGTCGSVTSGFSGLLTVNPLPVISGTTSVGIGETITLSGTTAAASSSPWVSSVPGVATVSNLGVVTALALGTTTITYTNTYGCTDTESITVTVGTTQPPTLTSPATGTSGVSTLNISYTLPELPLANSVRLTFTPTAGGTPIVWTMSNATAATFAYTVGTNPTSLSPIVSGSPLDFTTYNLTLSYQDVYGNPATSVTNTSIQILAPPANLSYSLPSTFIKDSVVTNIVPSITGTATSFSVSPALPTGLTLNTTTGVISGTPTVAATLTSYVVTATNSSGSTTYSLSFAVDKATPTIASMAAITKTFGDVPFRLTAPTSNGTGAFTFTSTDTAVATISGTTVTIVGAGTATITATQATDANYLVGSTSTTLTVNKATPVLSNFNAITTTIDSPSFTLTAPTSSGGTGAISYTSSNTTVATISGTTVTMVGAGTAIITATQASDANYNSQSITALLTVGIGTTQSPILTSPATGTSGVSTLNIIYTLPETPLAGSVRLTFTTTAGGTPIVWTMSNATAATFAYTVGTNPTSLSPIVSGSPLAFISYNITLSYQDVYGSPVASATNTSIQFLAPPNITLANTSYSGLVNTVFTTITVTSTGGAVSSFAISPNLPAGLTLNTTTGSISGTPTVALTATNFTITAINLTGTASVQFNLLINTGANNQIVDTDGDGVLDSIDTDDDGDGVLDVNDAFPINKNEWTDTDRDGIGNNADTDDDNDGILDGCDVDVNGDGIPDNGTDLDADGINDGCDTDKDGDGVNNTSDNCPNSPNTNQADRDRDGQGDICDTVELNVAQAITPNGDGINDTWVIYNLGYHPGATVRVFNTYGVQVFYSANYQNNWGGNYEGKNEMLPVGSYLYQIDLGSDGTIDYQGWLYITK
jgi:gliding motility-associated-like protein